MTARLVDDAVVDLAERQHGVFSRPQALDLGASSWLIQRRVAAGVWIPVAEGVYRLRGFPRSWCASLMTAVLATAGPAVVSHEAAAALHGLDTFPRGPVVLTVRHGAGRLKDLARAHQLDDLLAEHVTERSGLPVTTVARTIVDLTAVCRRGRVDHALDDALAARRITIEEVVACFDAVCRRGKPGMRLMRALLAEHLPGYVPPSTDLERLLLRVLRNGGLPRPALQYPFPGRLPGEGWVDAAYAEAQLVIEADSRRWHTRKRDFAVDRQRDNETTLAGWRVLRFTWDDLIHRPEWVVSAVRAILEAVGCGTRTSEPRE
ncbi:MAG: type IV toxin-antitoxin system AbiEi family antitoxin domain-containing protein [Actinomycetota bacterium]